MSAAERPAAAAGSLLRRVLLVEDEPGLVLTLSDRLSQEGYSVEAVSTGEEGLQKALGERWDLVLLDVMLPGKSGLDVCRDLRRSGFQAPILMLTARAQVVDTVVGLKLGADDYLTKPFEMMELLARIEALLRRSPAGPSVAKGTYRFGNVVVDFRRAEVQREGKQVELSALEFKLLRYFIEHRGATLARDELLHEVWGYDSLLYSRTVDVHVSGLRQKLEERPSHPEFILTVHRLGYKFMG